jgi:hypothetical protein
MLKTKKCLFLQVTENTKKNIHQRPIFLKILDVRIAMVGKFFFLVKACSKSYIYFG